MKSLEDLAQRIRPDRTVLLLGAGASISSGAPTGDRLARILAEQLKPPPDGNDLAEICGIFENRVGRHDLVAAVRVQLRDLEPAGALLALPLFPWRAIFTTNFDQLVEKSYGRAKIDFDVYRTNFDFSTRIEGNSIPIYKMHGCVSQDISDGHNGRMLLTERDYDALQDYRQTLFNSLTFNMSSADTLVIGQSLRDVHLRELAKTTAELNAKSGTPGQIYLLVYERDADRALLLEQKGFEVAFGGLEDLIQMLMQAAPPTQLVHFSETVIVGTLPPHISAVTIDVAHARKLPPNPVRLFNGSPATYGDIAAGFTIPRAAEHRLLEVQRSINGYFLVLTGVAGVGKTCLARRLLYSLSLDGTHCWEQLGPHLLDVDAWIAVEAGLRQVGEQGVLFVDDCVQQLNLVNKLVDALGRLENSHLRLILTANSHQWSSRTKSPFFYRKGATELLSRLTEADMEQLVNLVDRQPAIRNLVEHQFSILSRLQQLQHLRDRCSAEMYVCLKHIFGSERLDDIILREYAELSEDQQDIYRHVAVLQAMGGRVHRQLILRLLGVSVERLQAMLTLLDGIVMEYDIAPKQGLYGWATRHDVIADVVATYKFAESDELFSLLERLIEGANPTVRLEMETIRAMCTTDWGISRLPDPEDQIALLSKLISTVPGERVPRRRLIRKYLDLSRIDDAARAIHAAGEAIGGDPIVNRYKVKLALQRAEGTVGIQRRDRVAMLQSARAQALSCIRTYPDDRYNYRTFAQVGVALARWSGDLSFLDEAIKSMIDAEQRLLDPELSKDRRQYEQHRRNLGHISSRTNDGNTSEEDFVAPHLGLPELTEESLLDEPV